MRRHVRTLSRGTSVLPALDRLVIATHLQFEEIVNGAGQRSRSTFLNNPPNPRPPYGQPTHNTLSPD